MRILLTGAGGFVGANVAGVLAAALAAGTPPGARLIAADLAPPGADTRRFLAHVSEHITWVTLDVRDRDRLRELVASEGVTHIVHGAAITALPAEEAARAVEIVDVNLGSTINVLAVAAAAPRVERVLLLSSSGVYAVPPHGRLPKRARQPEEGELALDGLYSITKRSSELLAARFAQLTGKKMAAVRLPAVYGPLEKPSATRPGTSTLHRLMEALRSGRAITVAGPQVGRDWTYVADAGDAIAQLLAAPQWHYSVYNVSCGHRHTFREVVAAFAAHGLQAAWVGGEQPADVAMRHSHERLPLDTRRLRRDTSFTPQYDLAGGIAAWLAAEPLQ